MKNAIPFRRIGTSICASIFSLVAIFAFGQAAVRAADPGRTKIIGNFRVDYKASPYTCNEYPWYDRIFMKPHTQIECDPKVWRQAEDLIRADLPQAVSSGSMPYSMP